VRARWQALAAPLLGIAAALGVLSSGSAVVAVLTMALVAGLAGYCVAVSPRLAIAGMTCVLALLIAQGLPLDSGDAPLALLLGTAGGIVQSLWSLATWAVSDREREPSEPAQAVHGAIDVLRANLTLRSASLRHALRFGAALAFGVAIYRVIDLGEHGYWVPLTILFVLKPGQGQTFERIAMRAAGTVAGLFLATALADVLGDQPVLTSVTLAAAAALAYALLALEYALFTTAITVYVVLLTDTLGAQAIAAADERALATAIGIAVAGLAFWVWGEADERALDGGRASGRYSP
jgi:hypothetical protein